VSDFGKVWADLATNFGGYLTVFIVFGVIFSFSMKLMGHKLSQFIPGFVILFVGALIIFYLAGLKFMIDFSIEAPLLALIIGLIISNIWKIPDWMKVSLRTEYYIKTGIVLLGATLPVTLILKAGPAALMQATIISVCTWLAILPGRDDDLQTGTPVRRGPGRRRRHLRRLRRHCRGRRGEGQERTHLDYHRHRQRSGPLS